MIRSNTAGWAKPASAAIFALALMLGVSPMRSALAQEKGAASPPSKKISKGSGAYEEHYELLPAEGPEPVVPAQSGANLDPEGGAPPAPPSEAPASRRPTSGAAHKGTFGAPPAPSRVPAEAARPADDAPAKAQAAEPSERKSTEKSLGKAPAALSNAMPSPEPASSTEPGKSKDGKSEAKRAKAETLAKESADSADGGPAASAFEPALARLGKWVDHPKLGRVFAPTVGDDWRPYTRGRWSFTEDLGWVWISQDPFGWATDHYGRWSYDTGETRWVWVPGTEWAPAWVVWRQGEEAVGWAPVPPEAQWKGSTFPVDANKVESEAYHKAWVFVAPRYFGQPGMARFIRPARWTPDLLGRTFARVGFEKTGDVIANRGIDVKDIERLGQKPVARTRIAFTTDERFKLSTASAGDQIKLYRPDARRLATGTAETSTGERRYKGPKAQTHFTRAPSQRFETEGGVTESWVSPPAADPKPSEKASEKPSTTAASAPSDAPAETKPHKAHRAEAEEGDSEPRPEKETSVLPAEKKDAAAKADAAPETGAVKKSTTQRGEGRPREEEVHGSRYESYSVPSAEETGDAPAASDGKGKASSAAAPSAGKAAAQVKRQWDGSGASGAPAMVPGAVQ